MIEPLIEAIRHMQTVIAQTTLSMVLVMLCGMIVLLLARILSR